MTYAEFVNRYNGQSIDYDGVYGAQCVDLAKFYLRDVYGISPGAWGDAHAYWNSTNPAILAKFDKVANGATNVPKQGDILVYSQNTPGSGGAGHIEIFDRKTGPGKYVSFSQNWGGAYAHMVEHTDNYKYVLGWLTPKQLNNGGGTMAETINDDSARQIGWHYLGRNGFDGKPNALQAPQGDIQGKALTNAQMSAFFLSAEARDWRDSRIHKVYAERDGLKSANANLTAERDRLAKANVELTATVSRLNGEVLGLAQTVKEKQAEINTLQDQVVDLEKENKELKAQLATCGNNEDTEWLNKLGEALRWLIARIGVKK